jgi:pyruvate dehydrogenase E2 component (dihydrolipoamide acetyltransferase)
VTGNDNVYAGPAVRKLARQLGATLANVKGSGPRGRLNKDDVRAYVKQIVQQVEKGGSAATGGSGIPAIPEVDFSKFGDIELKKLSKIQKITANNMVRNWLNVPHVTQWDDADISDLEAFRKGLKAEAEKRGSKMTPLPFLLKACAAALRAEPSFNVSLHADGEHVVQKDYVHIGIAVDSPVGLVVPVIKDVDKKSLWELADEFTAIVGKARAGKLMPKDMQGGCFTISSLGAMGGNGFTPIVNAPEVAILGVSKAQMKPVWNGKDFEPRNMLPLSLSYDHRAVNGADAGRFFTYLTSVLADVRRLLL